MTMKTMLGLFTVLVLVSAVALGQEYLPQFPQAANPALTNGRADQSSPSSMRELPSSMAANQSSTNEESFALPQFPQAAHPALTNVGADQSSSNQSSTDEARSPSSALPQFPQAANSSMR